MCHSDPSMRCHPILTCTFNYINMEEPVIQLSHKEFLKVDRNYEQAAAVAKLVYVKDSQPGIQRLKKGNNFTYIYDSKPLTGEAQLERIRKLVIPPAWENVWICP